MEGSPGEVPGKGETLMGFEMLCGYLLKKSMCAFVFSDTYLLSEYCVVLCWGLGVQLPTGKRHSLMSLHSSRRR